MGQMTHSVKAAYESANGSGCQFSEICILSKIQKTAETTSFQEKEPLKDDNPGCFRIRDCLWGTSKMDLRSL